METKSVPAHPTITQPNQPPDTLTVKQVAEVLHYTEAHVRRIIRSGKLAASKPGRQYVVERAALDGFLAGDAKSPEERAADLAAAVAAQAPELTADQRARLAALLA